MTSVGIRDVGRGYSQCNEKRRHKRRREKYSRRRIGHASGIHLPMRFFRRTSRRNRRRQKKISRRLFSFFRRRCALGVLPLLQCNTTLIKEARLNDSCTALLHCVRAPHNATNESHLMRATHEAPSMHQSYFEKKYIWFSKIFSINSRLFNHSNHEILRLYNKFLLQKRVKE